MSPPDDRFPHAVPPGTRASVWRALALGAILCLTAACDQPTRAGGGWVHTELSGLWDQGDYEGAYRAALRRAPMGHPFTAQYIRRALNQGVVPPEEYPEAVEGLAAIARSTPDVYLMIATMARSDPEFGAAAGSPVVWYEQAFERGLRGAAFEAALYELEQGNLDGARLWAGRGAEAQSDRLRAGDPVTVNRALRLWEQGALDLSLEEHMQLVDAAGGAANAQAVEALARRIAQERSVDEARPYLQAAFEGYGAISRQGNGWGSFRQSALAGEFPEVFGLSDRDRIDLLMVARQRGFEMASLNLGQMLDAAGLATAPDGTPRRVFWQEAEALMEAMIARDDGNWWPYAQLATIYWDGKSGRQDRALAVRYLSMAVERDRPQLQSRLDSWRRILAG